ncbi:MAG TPA: GNAT family N-acetyltransferase [Roseiflexaceae bacterium]|nr:GNAT family N-acetyltransferase [Roseiflexaceae bacterium]
MPFFRRPIDIQNSLARPAGPADVSPIARLLRDSAHRFLAAGTNLSSLLGQTPALLLCSGTSVWGAAVAGWPADGVTWLRALVVADEAPMGPAMDALLPPFHSLLRDQGIGSVFYAGDLSADSWALPTLQAHGYSRATEVIVYEKRQLDVPSTGNEQARVRRAQAVDLPDVLAIDAACFEPQWYKDESVLGPAIMGEAPFFVVAELEGRMVGFAFATSHFGGRLVHLVRIAVHPDWQGHALGVRLLTEVTDYARSLGADSLTLNTQLENHTAQRLYEWFGFRRTGERQTVLRYTIP